MDEPSLADLLASLQTVQEQKSTVSLEYSHTTVDIRDK